MPDHHAFEPADNPLQDCEYPDEDEADGLSETCPCPECGAEVYEDAVQCPVCGQFITPGSRNLWSGRSVWWILLAMAGVGAAVWVLLTGIR